MANVRHVYHLAGIAKLWSRDRSDFDRVNAGGTAAVLRAAAAHRVERVVHCSTEAILLPKRRGADALIDETVRLDLADMPGPYTRSKLTAEQSVLAAVSGGLDALIVNPTVPIGPGDRNLTPPAAMLSMFLNGQVAGLSRLRAQSGRRARRCGRHGARGGARPHRRALHPRRRQRRAARPLELAGADIGASDAEACGARMAGASVGGSGGVGGRPSDRPHAGGDAGGRQAGAAVRAFRQSEGAP